MADSRMAVGHSVVGDISVAQDFNRRLIRLLLLMGMPGSAPRQPPSRLLPPAASSPTPGGRKEEGIGPLFPLGRVVITANALSSLDRPSVLEALGRHGNGAWGSLDQEDREANESALNRGARLLSAYEDASGTAFWIITEWDRSVTTILLPRDY